MKQFRSLIMKWKPSKISPEHLVEPSHFSKKSIFFAHDRTSAFLFFLALGFFAVPSLIFSLNLSIMVFLFSISLILDSFYFSWISTCLKCLMIVSCFSVMEVSSFCDSFALFDKAKTESSSILDNCK